MSPEDALKIFFEGPQAVVDRICELDETVRRQANKIEALENKIARLSKNSSNSGKRPSSDDIVKPKPSGKKNGDKKRKIGGQPGHPRHERPLFAHRPVRVHCRSIAQIPVFNFPAFSIFSRPCRNAGSKRRRLEKVAFPRAPWENEAGLRKIVRLLIKPAQWKQIEKKSVLPLSNRDGKLYGNPPKCGCHFYAFFDLRHLLVGPIPKAVQVRGGHRLSFAYGRKGFACLSKGSESSKRTAYMIASALEVDPKREAFSQKQSLMRTSRVQGRTLQKHFDFGRCGGDLPPIISKKKNL